MEQIPITLYINLFTLCDKDPKENKYIDIFYIWFSYLIKYSKLKLDDTFVLMIDTKTFDFLKSSYMFKTLIQLRNNLFKFNIITYEPPISVENGMVMRYHIKTLPNINKQQIFIHLDIDVLITNDIRMLFEENDIAITNNTKSILYIKNHGFMLENNFYGELITDEEKQYLKTTNQENMGGFTSGIFAWINQPNSNYCLRFFEQVLEKDKDINDTLYTNKDIKKLYTHDQVCFNYAIFQNAFKPSEMKMKMIKFNNINNNEPFTKNSINTILVDYCGIPGDDSFHWNKIFYQLIINFLE